MAADQNLYQKKIEEAKQAVLKVDQKLQEETTANRLALEKFYGTLTIVAAGALVLSVNYLGSLRAGGIKPVDFWYLKSSWASLLFCVAASVFYLNFHISYVHYARFREKADKLKSHSEAAMEGIDAITVIDEQGVQWLNNDLKASLAKEISGFDEDRKWNKKREDLYARLYTWAGRLAQLSFLLGIIFLLLFATANV